MKILKFQNMKENEIKKNNIEKPYNATNII